MIGWWADEPVAVRLTWPGPVAGLRAPAIDSFQEAATFAAGELIMVPPSRGLIITTSPTGVEREQTATPAVVTVISWAQSHRCC